MSFLFNREILDIDKARKNNQKNKKRAQRRKNYRAFLKNSAAKKMTGKGAPSNAKRVTFKSNDTDKEKFSSNAGTMEIEKVQTNAGTMKKGNTFLNEQPSPRKTGMTAVLVTTTTMKTRHIQWIQRLEGEIIDINVNFLSMVARAAPSKRSRTKWECIGNSKVIKNYIHHRGQWVDYCSNEGYEIDYETAFENQILEGTKFKGFEYKASYLISLKEDIQEPHLDYEWEPLKANFGKLYIFLFPLSCEGMELQIGIIGTKREDKTDVMERRCSYHMVLVFFYLDILFMLVDSVQVSKVMLGHIYTSDSIMPYFQ